MTKTFTCRELGGICDQKFSGETLMDIVNQGMAHMMSDEAHKEKIMNMGTENSESKEQWMERMKKEFDAKPEDK
jgi:hypothetical protein